MNKTLLLVLAAGFGFSAALSSCAPRVQTSVPYTPGQSVSQAVICDPDGATRTWRDDCDRVNGYYIHPTFGYGYFSPFSQPIIIDNTYRGNNFRPGQTHTFSTPRVAPPISQTTRAPQLTPPPNRPARATPSTSSGTNFKSPTNSKPGTVSKPLGSRSGASFSSGGKSGG